MSKLREAESGRVLRLVMDALAESLRYVANTMLEDGSLDIKLEYRSPEGCARSWIAMDISGPVRATVALECPEDDPVSAAKGSAQAEFLYAEILNVAVSHMVTDLYNNGYAVTISVPYTLDRLGDHFTRFASLSTRGNKVLRIAFSGPPK